MPAKKNKEISKKAFDQNVEEIDELNVFIEKKRIQNKALKKIVDKLNSKEDHKNNK